MFIVIKTIKDQCNHEYNTVDSYEFGNVGNEDILILKWLKKDKEGKLLSPFKKRHNCSRRLIIPLKGITEIDIEGE